MVRFLIGLASNALLIFIGAVAVAGLADAYLQSAELRAETVDQVGFWVTIVAAVAVAAVALGATLLHVRLTPPHLLRPTGAAIVAVAVASIVLVLTQIPAMRADIATEEIVSYILISVAGAVLGGVLSVLRRR